MPLLSGLFSSSELDIVVPSLSVPCVTTSGSRVFRWRQTLRAVSISNISC